MDKELFNECCEEYLEAEKNRYVISFKKSSHRPDFYELENGLDHPLIVHLLFPGCYSKEDIQSGLQALDLRFTISWAS